MGGSESLSPSWPKGMIPKLPPVPKERKPLRARSKSTADRDARYAVERVEFLTDHPVCEARWDEGCTLVATEVHHQGGRGRTTFFRRSWWLASCSQCHHRITTNPAEAFKRGLSFHRNGVEG